MLGLHEDKPSVIYSQASSIVIWMTMLVRFCHQANSAKLTQVIFPEGTTISEGLKACMQRRVAHILNHFFSMTMDQMPTHGSSSLDQISACKFWRIAANGWHPTTLCNVIHVPSANVSFLCLRYSSKTNEAMLYCAMAILCHFKSLKPSARRSVHLRIHWSLSQTLSRQPCKLLGSALVIT